MQSNMTVEPMHTVAGAIKQRGMALPALCFVLSYRPLAFLIAQTLYLFDPLAALLGQPQWRQWANLLADPAGVQSIEHALTTPTDSPVGQ